MDMTEELELSPCGPPTIHYQSVRKDNSDENFRLLKLIWDNISIHTTTMFQKGLGCLTVSSNLHETLFHKLELGSNTFTNLLLTQAKHSTLSGYKV